MTGAAGVAAWDSHVQRARRCACPRRSRIGGGECVGAGRQVRRREAPGAGAARGRGSERARAAIRHRHGRAIRRSSGQGHGVVGIDHAVADDRSGLERVLLVVRLLLVTVLLLDWIYENCAVARRLNVLRVVSVDRISGDGCVGRLEGLDAGAAVAVDRVVLDKDSTRVTGIGVEDDAFAIGDRAGAVRREPVAALL